MIEQNQILREKQPLGISADESKNLGTQLDTAGSRLSNGLPLTSTPQVFSTSTFPKQYRSEASIYIGRKGPWGNPFAIGVHGTRDEVIEKYRADMTLKLSVDPALRKSFVEALSGKHLICHCKPLACHGDVILDLLQLIARDQLG